MLGKIKNYEVNDNLIKVILDDGIYNVEIIKEDIVRFKVKFDKKEYISKAVP